MWLMDSAREKDRPALEALLRDNPEAQARYARLPDYKKKICLDWIADAATPGLREQRVVRLVRRLWLTAFDPMLHLYAPTFSELDDLYGPPQPLLDLPPDEQDRAVAERRVLGTYHYRNFDDGGTRFYIIEPGHKRFDPVMMVYAPPCVLTESLMRWLNYNDLETVRELCEWFDQPYDR
jgi:hypothetical protein